MKLRGAVFLRAQILPWRVRALLLLSLVLGCTEEVLRVVEPYEASVALNSCVQAAEGCSEALRVSEGGCLALRSGERQTVALVRYEGDELSFVAVPEALPIGPGAMVEATLLLFSTLPDSCAETTIESACEADCVARLSQPPFRWEGSELTLSFRDAAGRCLWESPAREIAQSCETPVSLDRAPEADLTTDRAPPLECEEGALRECERCGQSRCEDGRWGGCLSPESCCDPSLLGVACDTGLLGLCASGSVQCVDLEAGESACVPLVEAAPELCDGEDNDCDGKIDEGFTDGGLGVGERCVRGEGPCAQEGSVVCLRIDEARCDAVPGEPGGLDDDCDGQDDDCDALLDEDFVPRPTTCGVGFCASEGRALCERSEAGNRLVDTCVPAMPGAAEDLLCDGVDEDCNGAVDEDFVAAETRCGVGVCAARGRLSCRRGVVLDSCVPQPELGDDANCNELDEDCDGDVDEDFPSTPVDCGVGACSRDGQTFCAAGEIADSCRSGEPEPDDETCDGVDDDCDGEIDEDFPVREERCGQGVCLAVGSRICRGGAERLNCTPGEPAALQDSECNLLDDDCDGLTDESYLPTRTSCGQGLCAAEGLLRCVRGVPTDDCAAGEPAPSDARCDSIDEDCDGRFDEAFEGEPTRCGQGVCAATGESSCVDGNIRQNCTPEDADDLEDLCGGGDGDCDGVLDEGFRAQATECGLGVCASVGFSSCVEGEYSSGCIPGPEEEALDRTCDLRDGDCDGGVDEDFIVVQESCGTGACARRGPVRCDPERGITVHDCTPGMPLSATDMTCDGQDDNCNGFTDEGFFEQRRCGLGLCEIEVALECVDGEVVDECAAQIPPGEEIDGCDEGDEDCDGRLDEDCQDRDRDGVLDDEDNCPDFGESPSQIDSGAGLAGDLCDWTRLSLPGREVELLTHEVTVGAYRACIAAGACSRPPFEIECSGGDQNPPSEWDATPDNYPVGCLRLDNWQSYCGWVGGALPTVEELNTIFELFPGSPFTDDCASGNFSNCPGAPGTSTPVCGEMGSSLQNGLCDFVGNLREGTRSPDPEIAMLRYFNCYGSFIDNRNRYDTCSTARPHVGRTAFLGFRCIREVNE